VSSTAAHCAAWSLTSVTNGNPAQPKPTAPEHPVPALAGEPPGTGTGWRRQATALFRFCPSPIMPIVGRRPTRRGAGLVPRRFAAVNGIHSGACAKSFGASPSVQGSAAEGAPGRAEQVTDQRRLSLSFA
jgi:hypothetical protein